MDEPVFMIYWEGGLVRVGPDDEWFEQTPMVRVGPNELTCTVIAHNPTLRTLQIMADYERERDDQ